MVDANQQWTLPQALDICARLKEIDPFWIEEPTHPDDVIGHKTLADAIAPVKLALGEHVPNRIIFKNYLRRNVRVSSRSMPCASRVSANSSPSA
jgi:L-fuconate dehydratase